MQGSLQPMAAPLYPVRNPLFSRSASFFLHDYNMKRRNVKEFWWFLLICSKFQPSPFLSSSQVSLEASNSFRTACGGRSSRRYFCPATKVPKNAFIHRLKVAASGHSTNAPRATKPMGKRLPKVEGYIETTDTTVDVRAGFACAVFSSAGCALLHWEFILVRYLVETPAFPWKSGHRPPCLHCTGKASTAILRSNKLFYVTFYFWQALSRRRLAEQGNCFAIFAASALAGDNVLFGYFLGRQKVTARPA